MRHEIDHSVLMQYIDGELTTEESREVERHLENCTECHREVAVFRAMKDDFTSLNDLEFDQRSVWDGVRRRIIGPIGWILLAGGALIFAIYFVYTLLTAPGALWERLATGAIWLGLLLLLLMVGMERFREWKTDPYREIER